MKPTEYLTITERPNTSITVMSDSRGPLIVASDGPGARAVRYTPDDAPALALAILEAAGYDDMADDANLADVHAFNAMHKLQESVDTQERATAEAKEQAELEAEALELYNARILFIGGEALTSFEKLNQDNKDMWLAVARKAREMNGAGE